MTKKEMFTAILNLGEIQANPDMVDFLNHEVELLERKNSGTGTKRMTAQQTANEALKGAIYEAMEPGKLYMVSDIVKLMNDPENATQSRVSSLMRQMDNEKGDGRVMRSIEKRKTYYQKVEGYEAD